jgi:hypothetical protein
MLFSILYPRADAANDKSCERSKSNQFDVVHWCTRACHDFGLTLCLHSRKLIVGERAFLNSENLV